MKIQPRLLFKLLASLFLLTVLLAAYFPVKAFAGTVTLDNVAIHYEFGNKIIFSAKLQTPAEITDAILFIRPEGSATTFADHASKDSQGMLTYTYDTAQHPLRAFITIEYWYNLAFADGTSATSPTYSFYYDDNRFDWQTMENGPFRVHWYKGDAAFAQRLLDAASEGLQKAQTLLPFPSPKQIDIYDYATVQDLRSTLLSPSKKWAAGHADPDLAVMAVSLGDSPEDRMEVRRQIPHELAHILLYELLGQTGYERLPIWLNEGLASMNELIPWPDYQVYLRDAVDGKKLIPISSLCQSFPLDAYSAQLSYAEADSFTRYVYNQYGTTGMKSLVSAFANGLSCNAAPASAFNASLETLEANWLKASFGQTRLQDAVAAMLPWIFMLGLVLAPLAFVAFGGPKKARPQAAQGSVLHVGD